MTAQTPDSVLQTQLAHCEAGLSLVIERANLPETLAKACQYAVCGGGKRIRPLLCLGAFWSLVGENAPDLNKQMAMRSALAVELLHGYSLVHDDLPCMDDDELRRGLPTCHIAFGEGVALLVGDVLQSLSFEVLTMPLPDWQAVDFLMSSKLNQVFAPRARRMVTGQFLDTVGEGQDLTQQALQAIHADKTGALIEASILMGGICAGADDEMLARLERFAKLLGLAFQVQDDVLDVVSDTETLGKPVGSDEKLDKATYVKLLGVAGASAYANELFEQAKEVALTVNADAQKNLLWQLTERVANRKK